MKKKEIFDSIAKYANEVMRYIDDISSPSYSLGETEYLKYDLIVVYKINRMLELKVISEKKYYRLMYLYYKYLQLSDELFNYFDDIDSEEYNKKYDVYELIKTFLEPYELLPEYYEYPNIIDTSIKRTQRKNK